MLHVVNLWEHRYDSSEFVDAKEPWQWWSGSGSDARTLNSDQDSYAQRCL